MSNTNLPDGVTNVFEYLAMGKLPMPNPARDHTFFTDFNLYTATDWTVTETQAGATQAIVANGDGGQLALVNTAANDDVNAIKLVNNTFVAETEKAIWFTARVKVDDGALSDVLVGLVDTMAAFNPAYGIYLYRDAVAGTFRLSVESNSVVTNSTDYADDVADDTFYDLAITYDPNTGKVEGWVNDAPVLSISDLTNFPTAALAPAVGLRNGDANARTLTIDYVLATKAR